MKKNEENEEIALHTQVPRQFPGFAVVVVTLFDEILSDSQQMSSSFCTCPSLVVCVTDYTCFHHYATHDSTLEHPQFHALIEQLTLTRTITITITIQSGEAPKNQARSLHSTLRDVQHVTSRAGRINGKPRRLGGEAVRRLATQRAAKGSSPLRKRVLSRSLIG